MTALPVACRGVPDAVWWQAGTWAVVPYGLIEVGTFNAIPADRLADLDTSGGRLRWIALMDEAGIDLDQFLTALPVALALHGHTSVNPALIPANAKAYRKNLRRLAYEAGVREAEARKQVKQSRKQQVAA